MKKLMTLFNCYYWILFWFDHMNLCIQFSVLWLYTFFDQYLNHMFLIFHYVFLFPSLLLPWRIIISRGVYLLAQVKTLMRSLQIIIHHHLQKRTLIVIFHRVIGSNPTMMSSLFITWAKRLGMNLCNQTRSLKLIYTSIIPRH